jgi:hypothetical protein
MTGTGIAGWERALGRSLAQGTFDGEEIAGLPEPVQRHLTAAIRSGSALTTAVALKMRGRIKVGRWLPFRARQVLSPHEGFLWTARAAGLIAGSDRYLDGVGAMQWKVAGLITVAYGEGRDVSRSAAGRVGAQVRYLRQRLQQAGPHRISGRRRDPGRGEQVASGQGSRQRWHGRHGSR